MRVGVDLDGVCYSFDASLRAYLLSIGKQGEFPEATRWEFYEDWGLDLPAFLTTCDAGVDAGIIFAHGDPFPEVAEAFALIREAGHSIHIVTDRSFGSPGASAAATIGWLAKHGLAYDSITFSADKTVANVDVMIDDKPSNYEALVSAGVNAFLLSRAWNSHVQDAKRVASLLEFAEVIS